MRRLACVSRVFTAAVLACGFAGCPLRAAQDLLPQPRRQSALAIGGVQYRYHPPVSTGPPGQPGAVGDRRKPFVQHQVPLAGPQMTAQFQHLFDSLYFGSRIHNQPAFVRDTGTSQNLQMMASRSRSSVTP